MIAHVQVSGDDDRPVDVVDLYTWSDALRLAVDLHTGTLAHRYGQPQDLVGISWGYDGDNAFGHVIPSPTLSDGSMMQYWYVVRVPGYPGVSHVFPVSVPVLGALLIAATMAYPRPE